MRKRLSTSSTRNYRTGDGYADLASAIVVLAYEDVARGDVRSLDWFRRSDWLPILLGVLPGDLCADPEVARSAANRLWEQRGSANREGFEARLRRDARLRYLYK